MYDQRLARKDLERWRGIEIVIRHLAVRCGAAIDLVGEDKEVLYGYCHGVELDLALVCGECHLEHAILTRKRYRFSELRSDGWIEFAVRFLRSSRRPPYSYQDAE